MSSSNMPELNAGLLSAGGARQALKPKGVQPDKRSDAPDVVAPWHSRRAFIKWFFPCVLVGFGGYIGSAGLHFASYNFVHEMDEWNATNAQFREQHDIALALEVEARFASNRDPVAKLLGPQQQIAMGTLDLIAAFFPSLFVALMMLTKRVELWTKVMVCTALLAAIKGIIGAVTTVPDSSGWEICRDAHLQADGYAWMREDRTFLEIVTVDFWWFPTHGRPLRYCSDMMFSGHTFFVTLYALALYEVALIWTHSVTQQNLQIEALDPFSRWVAEHIQHWRHGSKTFFRASVLFFVSSLAIGQQAFEIYYVLLSRFHYTSDVVVALVLTFLFYTNGAVSIFAKQWALRDFHFLFGGHLLPTFYFGGQKAKKWNLSKRFPLLEDVNDVHKIPACCVLSCHGAMEDPPYPEARVCPKCNGKCKDLSKHCRGCGNNLEDGGMKDKTSNSTWISRGDIFVPFCCFPCCCLAGREHVYSDDGVEGFRLLIDNDSDPTNDIDGTVIDHMHMHEGICSNDVQEMKEWVMGRKGQVEVEGSKMVRHFNPWAFRYSHPISANFLEQSMEDSHSVPEFKDLPARKCPGCSELMPYSSKYDDKKDWKEWDYSHCIGCGHELKEAKKVKWGDELHKLDNMA